MEAKEKEILRELISGNKCQFIIPVFQRNYDWREKDCKKLFNDVISLAKDTKHPTRQHFLGAFVYKFNKIVETQFIEYILIDGQQRLTSVTLMLKALYDHLASYGDKYEELRQEINETYLINKFAKSSSYKLKLKPNEVDNDNYIKLIENESGIDTTSTIFRNYASFLSWIEVMDVSVEDFYRALQRLEGVGVQLDDTDNPQLIFESLNSTGLELTDVDLIRNYLLMNCESSKQTFLYKEYWLKLEQILGDNFVLFVRDYISFMNGAVTSGSKNMVYDAFQKYFRSLDQSTEEFLQGFVADAKIYNRLLVAPEKPNTNLNAALIDYIELDMKTTYPFVFGLLKDNEPDAEGHQKIDDETLTKLLRVLESYLIRRNVCNLAGGGMSQVMASLYNQLKQSCGEALYTNIVDTVSNALVGITSKAYFPRNEEFVRELTERDMYKNRNIDFILKRLEKMQQGKEVADLDSLSVEHVIPQKLSDDWIKYLGYNKNQLEELQRDYINRIGNLTLTAYNSEMSNKLFAEKKAHIDFSRLVLNQYFKDKENWDKDEIEQRGKVIANLAMKLWPFPKVKGVENLFQEGHFICDDSDDFEFAGTTPNAVKVKDKDFLVTSWQDVFVEVLRCYYNDNKELFVSLFGKPGLISDKRVLISDKKNDIWYGVKFEDDYYIDLYIGGTDRKIKLLKDALALLQADPSDVVVFFA
ncbi:MAG: DUF262 domain-containing protein [Bacilli bacterium]|nr:DUF262 domain-containing protein [Bacilli bacterium]